eukprot:gene970-1052_t
MGASSVWSREAHLLLSSFAAASFVLVLYLIPSRIRALPRDDLLHVKYRLTAATFSTVLSLTLLHVLVPVRESLGVSLLQALGLVMDWRTLQAILLTSFLIAVFYLGPIVNYAASIVHSARPKSFSALCAVLWRDLEIYRDSQHPLLLLRALVFAPVLEEVVYRAVIILSQTVFIVQLEGRDNVASYVWSMAVYTPLWFGAAHLHHLFEKLRLGQSVMVAVLSTVLQVTYTTIFGCMAALLYMRCGTLLAAITSHCICNFVGLPDVSFLSQKGNSLVWKTFLVLLHLLGLAGFAVLLYPTTESLSKGSFFYSV